MTVIVITKDGVEHVHTLIDKFNIYNFYSLIEGNVKSFELYGYNFYRSYRVKDISNIKFDFNAN